jgi:hypothetical protein
VLVAVGAAALGIALAVYLLVERVGAAGIPLAVLRAFAWASVAALLMDPGCRRAGGAAPTVVLLDHSLSMSAPGDTLGGARWRAALDTARAIAGRTGHVLLFGTAPVPLGPGARPDAAGSFLAPAWREAAAFGGPVAVVTDGEVDDAGDLPADVLRAARVVVFLRPPGADAGVAGLDLPVTLRAGDTVTAVITVVASGTTAPDTVTIELREGARPVARERLAVGRGGTFKRELRFVPAPPGGEREVRRFTAVVRGLGHDVEPRDDARATVAEVTRASTVALFSDSPDWDFRALAAALGGTSGVPVSAFVRVAAAAPWRDARTLEPVAPRVVEAAARQAALVVLHGTPGGTAAARALARHSEWDWTQPRAAAGTGDWYVAPSASASPLGAALAGVPPDSLPPLQAVGDVATDSGAWVGLVAQLGRRGPARAVIVGREVGGRREVRVVGFGLWRWASAGGVAAEGYRALVAATTNWLLQAGPHDVAAVQAERDTLDRAVDELLPHARTLRAQPGVRAATAAEPAPLRHSPWPYAVALGALVLEWIARRRRGMR